MVLILDMGEIMNLLFISALSNTNERKEAGGSMCFQNRCLMEGNLFVNFPKHTREIKPPEESVGDGFN